MDCEGCRSAHPGRCPPRRRLGGRQPRPRHAQSPRERGRGPGHFAALALAAVFGEGSLAVADGSRQGCREGPPKGSGPGQEPPPKALRGRHRPVPALAATLPPPPAPSRAAATATAATFPASAALAPRSPPPETQLLPEALFSERNSAAQTMFA